jgi:hypothetical protein
LYRWSEKCSKNLIFQPNFVLNSLLCSYLSVESIFEVKTSHICFSLGAISSLVELIKNPIWPPVTIATIQTMASFKFSHPGGIALPYEPPRGIKVHGARKRLFSE